MFVTFFLVFSYYILVVALVAIGNYWRLRASAACSVTDLLNNIYSQNDGLIDSLILRKSAEQIG